MGSLQITLFEQCVLAVVNIGEMRKPLPLTLGFQIYSEKKQAFRLHSITGTRPPEIINFLHVPLLADPSVLQRKRILNELIVGPRAGEKIIRSETKRAGRR